MGLHQRLAHAESSSFISLAFCIVNKVILKQPVAVFDAGIGSYAIARKIADRFPGEDVLYFADRANFPYGGKDKTELLAVMRGTIKRLESFGPSAIVIASNAPSVMVLDDSRAGAGRRSSACFHPSGARWRRPRQSQIDLVSASDLVELVENGTFLMDAERALTAVRAKLDTLHPDTDVATLSSTHLPWLLRYFEQAGPRMRFLDPADDVVEAVAPYTTSGSGAFRTLVSEREGYDLADFQRMLARLGLELTVERT